MTGVECGGRHRQRTARRRLPARAHAAASAGLGGRGQRAATSRWPCRQTDRGGLQGLVKFSPGVADADADVHTDTASGAKASRPALDLVLKLLREGDVPVITRLGRFVLHLVTSGAQLRGKGARLLVTE